MSDNDKLVENVLIALRRITRAIDLHSRRLVQDYSLTGPQLLILQMISKQDEAPIGNLAQQVNLSNATVTGIIDRLEKRGLVERVRGVRDRRQVIVRGTEKGREILAEAPPPLQEEFVRALKSLPPERQDQILKCLNHVAAMMNADGLDVGAVLASQSLSEEPSYIKNQ